MSDWNSFKDNMPSSGSGDILKLEDGKPVKVRVVGEPYVFQSEYQGKLSTRFAVVIWNQGVGAAQLLMLPKTPFAQIMDLATNDEWGDPEEYDITIKRTGTGKETEYTVQPSPNKKSLEAAAKEQASSVDIGAILSRLPSVHFSMPLSEANNEAIQTASKNVKPEQTDDVVEVTDEPVSLDDIPF